MPNARKPGLSAAAWFYGQSFAVPVPVPAQPPVELQRATVAPDAPVFELLDTDRDGGPWCPECLGTGVLSLVHGDDVCGCSEREGDEDGEYLTVHGVQCECGETIECDSGRMRVSPAGDRRPVCGACATEEQEQASAGPCKRCAQLEVSLGETAEERRGALEQLLAARDEAALLKIALAAEQKMREQDAAELSHLRVELEAMRVERDGWHQAAESTLGKMQQVAARYEQLVASLTKGAA